MNPQQTEAYSRAVMGHKMLYSAKVEQERAYVAEKMMWLSRER